MALTKLTSVGKSVAQRLSKYLIDLILGSTIQTMTITEASSNIYMKEGDKVRLSDRDNALFEYKKGLTPNGYNIIECSINPSLSLSLEITNTIRPIEWGVLDGVDCTSILQLISSHISSSTTVDFGTLEYLIEVSGVSESPYGHRIFDIDNKDGVNFRGERATFTVVNHDITLSGGLSIFWVAASKGIRFSGIDFDMTFKGINTSGTQYPFCSAILGTDGSNEDNGGIRTQDELNGDWSISDCTFKLFHPYGQYAQSGSSYLGDPNNGFKLFPATVFGAFDAEDYPNQCRGLTIDNCTIKEGSNSYGFWVWAWNDVTMTNSTAESFVGKQSNSMGVMSGRGEPMLRYHQFYCEGLKVIGNYFRAKPCNERLVSGFEGDSRFVDYNTNLLGNYGHGVCVISDNTIIGGRGDAANLMDDWYLNLIAYGSISVTGNTFGSTTETFNGYLSTGVLWNSEAVGGQGNANLTIIGNNWNAACDYMDNISIANGGTTPLNRRLKSLVIEGNTSLGQLQYFVKMSTTQSSFGVQDCRIYNNNVSGEFNTVYDKASTNSRAIEVSGSEVTDRLDISKNTIRDKYYGIETNGYSGSAYADTNVYVGVSSKYMGAVSSFITTDRALSAPSEAVANGSVYYRTDGVSGFSMSVREAGAWVVVG